MSSTTVTTATSAHTVALPIKAIQEPSPAAQDKTFQSLARGDRDGKLKLQGIPEFTDPYEKRKWMKEHMAAAFRFFGKMGYGEGVSGHISMRGTYRISNIQTHRISFHALTERVTCIQILYSPSISG
jgi:hypothetical protein